jgi:hypothetical protein
MPTLYGFWVWCMCVFRKSNQIVFGLQYAGTSWDELKHIRQAVGFLVSVSLFHNMAPFILLMLFQNFDNQCGYQASCYAPSPLAVIN